MSVKKSERQPLPIDPADVEVDPAVTAALGRPRVNDLYERIARARRMTPAQRKKAEKDRKRNRVILDIPELIEELLEVLSEGEHVSKSQMAAYLIVLGAQVLEEQLKQGQNNLSWIKRPLQSLRFEYGLNLPELPDGMMKKILESRRKKKPGNQGSEND